MKDSKQKSFISDENVSVRLFNNDFLDRLTRTHIAVPVTLFFLYAAGLIWWTKKATALSNLQIAGLFIGGMLFFTLVEYLVHRYVYHIEPTTERRRKFQWTMHGVHHAYPKDKSRLAMPPVLSVVIGTVLLGLFRLLMGQYAFSFLAGFMVGYALYLVVHYCVHIFKMPKHALRVLWINHAIHHYSQDDVMFGVSSPLWDYVFGTVPSRKKRENLRVVVEDAERYL
ncbi:MAG: sterol desaturase family protein [Saprospiraceae bacterium]|nr:sterol desaturase family protein [Saprospiraceae bacterium]MDW8483625.1 sterol desaturase family protein [Saprospiraceae bacterium]